MIGMFQQRQSKNMIMPSFSEPRRKWTSPSRAEREDEMDRKAMEVSRSDGDGRIDMAGKNDLRQPM